MDLHAALSSPSYTWERDVALLARLAARPSRLRSPCRPICQQTRLDAAAVDLLVARYQAGETLEQLGSALGLNRETVMLHLERRGIPRRQSLRKLNDDLIRQAADRYRGGEAMATIIADLRVDASTLRKELKRAGVPLRRPGRPSTRLK